MTRTIPLFVALLAALPVASAPAHARPGSLLAVTGASTGTATMLDVDADTGEGTVVAELSGPILTLAFNPHDGQLYGTLPDYTVKPTQFRLVTVDPAFGTITEIGAIASADGVVHNVAGMAFTDDGQLFGVSRLQRKLIAIDPATGAAEAVGDGLGVVPKHVGAAMLDDTFYFLTGDPVTELKLYTVDLDTGLASLVGATGIVDGGIGLSHDGDGNLVAVVDDSLYTVDAATGAAALVGVTGWTGLASLEFVDTLSVDCPCDADWKNHGEYVSCVAQAAQELEPGLQGEVVSEAGKSECGK